MFESEKEQKTVLSEALIKQFSCNKKTTCYTGGSKKLKL